MALRRTVQRAAIVAFVVCAAAALLAGLHYYIALRLVLEPGVPEPWRGGLLIGIAALAGTLVAQPFAERSLAPARARLVAWPAALWMGFAFLMLVGLGASDLLWWLGGATAAAAPVRFEAVGDAAALRALAVVTVALALGLLGLRIGLRPPVLERVEIALDRWPAALDGFRIVQISDVHIGSILGRRFAAQLAKRVQALEPDLVAVTGDLVDGGVAQLADEVAPLAKLRGRHGVFFVTGNHDHYSGANSWSGAVAELGMRVLRNQRVEIRDGDAVFDLVGVDDHRGSHLGDGGGEDLDSALAGRDCERPALLLAHDPSTFKRASRMGIDLQLSGHTHGGQIWPFNYLVRLAIPFVAGRYRRGGAELYVSRGTGFWGPPMRLFAPSEISEIVLRSPAAP